MRKIIANWLHRLANKIYQPTIHIHFTVDTGGFMKNRDALKKEMIKVIRMDNQRIY